MVWIAVLIYLGLGASLACWGTAARRITEEAESVEVYKLSTQKRRLYLAILYAAVVVFWPILVPSAYRNTSKGQRYPETTEKGFAEMHAPVNDVSIQVMDTFDLSKGPPKLQVFGLFPSGMSGKEGRLADTPIHVHGDWEVDEYLVKLRRDSLEDFTWECIGSYYQSSTSKLLLVYLLDDENNVWKSLLYFSLGSHWDFSPVRHVSVFVDQNTGKLRYSSKNLTADNRSNQTGIKQFEPPRNKYSGRLADNLVLADGRYIDADGRERYYREGQLNRVGGPALIDVYEDYAGSERHRSWYRDGMLHRDDGPAVVGGRVTNGNYEWWLHGKRHRSDGPAVINLFDSWEWGPGPVYQWWREGVIQKVQIENGTIIYFKEGRETLREYPDGSRTNMVTGKTYNIDGEEVDEPNFEYYNGYLKNYECFHDLYVEPEETFDKYNSAQ